MATQAQTPVGTFANTGATTLARAYGSNVTAGNLLIATCMWAGSATITCTVSGSLNGALTAIAGSLATNAGSVTRAQVFFKVAASSGAETLTMTTSGSTATREIVIYEVAGAAAAGHPDASSGPSGTSTNPTTTITTVAQPGLIVSYCSDSAGTVTAGAGYTGSVAQNGDQGQYKTYAATGSTSIPYVNVTNGQWVITAASFLDAGGGGGVVVKQLAQLGVG